MRPVAFRKPLRRGAGLHRGARALSAPGTRHAALAALALATSAPAAEYTVTVDAALARLAVDACFSGGTRSVAPVEPAALALLVEATARDGTPISPREDALPVPEGAACLRYVLDLERLAPDPAARLATASVRRSGTDLMLSPALWLWRPQPGGNPLRVRFDLPPGVATSVPWTRGQDGVHTVAATPADWAATTAFGRFREALVEVGGAQLRVAILAAQPPAAPADVQRWVTRAAHAVAAVDGRFPLPDVQVLVVPLGAGDEPVPFAQVLRGGGSALRFYIDQRRPVAEFLADWTAVHEFSHLLHPFLRGRDAWVAEGLASYYQNVLRARDGTLPAQEAWLRLERGFARGRAQTDGSPLTEVSADMHRSRRYMRVYWSGAAIALLADVELRARSRGAQSLDTVLARLRDCCLPATREWSALELYAKLDALAGEAIFVPLHRRWAGAGDFPDVGPAYARLGIAVSGNAVVTDPAAPLADQRRAIMCGAAGCPPVR